MAATDTPATLSELQTAFLDALKEPTGNTALNTLAARYLNIGLHDMHQEVWPWSERRAVLRTHDDYTTGTLSVGITARTLVEGTGTAWASLPSGEAWTNVRAGGKLDLGDNTPYVVLGVTTDTTLTLENGYAGATALTNVGYTYFEDEYALASDFARPADTNLRYFDQNREIQLLGPQAFYLTYPRNNRPRKPRHATLIELGPSGSVSLRPRIVLGPPPDAVYLIPYRYQTTNLAVSATGTAAANLSASTDQPIVPPRWRMGIVYKALEQWARDRQKSPLAAEYARLYELLMMRARAEHSAGNDRPRFLPKVESYRAHARRPWTGSGPRGYSTGTEFEDLRI